MRNTTTLLFFFCSDSQGSPQKTLLNSKQHPWASPDDKRFPGDLWVRCY